MVLSVLYGMLGSFLVAFQESTIPDHGRHDIFGVATWLSITET